MTGTRRDRIVVNQKILRGKPTIVGTRISVEFIQELLAEGWTTPQITDAYPQLTAEDVDAVKRIRNLSIQ
ncbi:MAG: DUF433 domain-containing protein [Candidatus Bathyarchaeia archaeon]